MVKTNVKKEHIYNLRKRNRVLSVKHASYSCYSDVQSQETSKAHQLTVYFQSTFSIEK